MKTESVWTWTWNGSFPDSIILLFPCEVVGEQSFCF